MAKKRIPKGVQKKIHDYVESVRADGTPIASVYLFGSYAQGKQHKWSDIDLCIVSTAFGKRIKNPQKYLWSKRFQLHDYVVEPIGFSPREFRDDTTFAYEVRRSGVRIM